MSKEGLKLAIKAMTNQSGHKALATILKIAKKEKLEKELLSLREQGFNDTTSQAFIYQSDASTNGRGLIVDERDQYLDFLIEHKTLILESLIEEQRFRCALNSVDSQVVQMKQLFGDMKSFVDSNMSKMNEAIAENSQ